MTSRTAVTDAGVAFVRSEVLCLEANRAPSRTALLNLYLRSNALPKSVMPITTTASNGKEIANSAIWEACVCLQYRQRWATQFINCSCDMAYSTCLLNKAHRNGRNSPAANRRGTYVSWIRSRRIQNHSIYVA